MSISAGATRQSLRDTLVLPRDRTILPRTSSRIKACELSPAAALVSETARLSPQGRSLSRTKSTMTCLPMMSMSRLGAADLVVAAHTHPPAPAHEADT